MPSHPRLFIDASVLIAASASPDGGSSLVMELCQAGKAVALVTRLVLREAERNIKTKLDDLALLRFYNLIAELDPVIVPQAGSTAIKVAAEIITAKDAHVLAAAQAADSTYLITLDRKHFLDDDQRKAILPIIACTPGEFLRALISQ